MAKIVEFVGPPGVGKTTIYRKIESIWNKNHNWAPGQFLYPRKKITSEKSGSFFLNFYQSIRNPKGVVDAKAMEDAGRRFVNMFPDYINTCWNNINHTQKKCLNGFDLRFEKVMYLYKLIQKIQTLREQKGSKTAIVDEGLIHIISSILYKKEVLAEERDEIEYLLETMPVPQGIVFIKTDVQENLKRLMQREKVIPVHKCLNTEDLKNIVTFDHYKRSMIHAAVENKKIPFISIESTEDVADSIVKIISFTNNI